MGLRITDEMKKAEEGGLRRFESIKCCHKGHKNANNMCVRYTVGGACVECVRLYRLKPETARRRITIARTWSSKHPQAQKAYQLRYRIRLAEKAIRHLKDRANGQVDTFSKRVAKQEERIEKMREKIQQLIGIDNGNI